VITAFVDVTPFILVDVYQRVEELDASVIVTIRL
jgi:hypothetical protein